MLRRIYIHNFRCLQNFELKAESPSVMLLAGATGVGKSSVAQVLYLLQQIGAGASRVSSLFRVDDFTAGHTGEQMLVEVDADVVGCPYTYSLALDMPKGFKALRVVRESFSAEGQPVFTREEGHVKKILPNNVVSEFTIDWHQVALPVIFESHVGDIMRFRAWLSNFLILSPVPKLMTGESDGQVGPLLPNCTNFASFLTRLLTDYPRGYSLLDGFVKGTIKGFKDIVNQPVAENARVIEVLFSAPPFEMEMRFDELSAGEKCLFLCGLVLAMRRFKSDLVVFWDEMEGFLTLREIKAFLEAWRQSASEDPNGQLWVATHSLEVAGCFSVEETNLVSRQGCVQPAILTPLAVLGDEGRESLANALNGDAGTLKS